MRLLLLAGDEARRALGSRRGLFAALVFALLWALVLVYAVRPAGLIDANEGGAGSLVGDLADRFGFESLLRWPSAQLAAGWIAALYLLPPIVLALSVDQIASDRARGTLRYLVLRASRVEIVLGRWLGQAAVMAMLVVVALGSTLVLVGLDAPERLGASITAALPAGLALWFSLLPWVALASLVSALARSARQALLLASAAWLVLSWLASVGANLLATGAGGQATWRDVVAGGLDYLVPGAVSDVLVRASAGAAPVAALPALVQAAAFVALAVVVLRRRSL